MADAEGLRTVAPLERAGFEDSGAGERAGVRFTDRRGLALGHLFARRGEERSLAGLLGLPAAPGRSLANGEHLALPLAPGQWMLLAERGADGSFCRGVRERIGGLGHISEQSHSRVVLRVSGERARDLLAKGCRLDLHPRAMQPGACAATLMARIGVLLHQVDDVPSYDLLVYSGFAHCFWEWLEESAQEFGFATAVEHSGGSSGS